MGNNLFNIVAFDPETDVQEGELVKYVDGGHDQCIAVDKTGNEERKDRHNFNRRKRNQAVEGNVPSCDESIDDKAHVD